MKKGFIFYATIGITDGIITTLLFTAGEILNGEKNINLSLVIRLAIGVAFPNIFTFFVAEYTRLRQDLIHASRELNISSPLRLINSRLGKMILRKAIMLTLIGTTSGFIGAILPLLISIMMPNISWLPIVISIFILGIFGVILSIYIHGKPMRWFVAMVFIGTLFAIVGSTLHIVK